METIRAFFPDSWHFFWIGKKKQGCAPPLPSVFARLDRLPRKLNLVSPE